MRCVLTWTAVAVVLCGGESGGGQLSDAVSFFGDLFAVASLCPMLKVDEMRLSAGPRPSGIDAAQWILIIEEGRRVSPEHIKELVALPQTSICDYGRKAYGSANGGYLVER